MSGLELTPDFIVNNLLKNFPKMVGSAIIGYNEFYKAELLLLEKMKATNDKGDLIIDYDDDVFINFKIFANMVKYGKSYFLNEIIKNMTQMNNLVIFMNTMVPLVNEMKKRQSNKGYVEEEPVVGGKKKRKVIQKGGGDIFNMFMSLVITILFTSLANSQEVASNLVGTNSQVVYTLKQAGQQKIDFETNQIPMATTKVQNFDPLNPDDRNLMTQEYGLNVVIPKINKIISENLQTLFLPQFIEEKRTNYGITENMKSFFQNDEEELTKLFISEIRKNVTNLNDLTNVVHPLLQKMCEEFIGQTDPLLPIPVYELYNSKLVEKSEILKENRDKIEVEQKKDIVKTELTQLGITQSEPSMVENIQEVATTVKEGTASLFSSVFSSAKKNVPTEVNAAEINRKDLKNIIQNVEDKANQNISSLRPDTETRIFNDYAQETAENLYNKQVNSDIIINRQSYLSTTCNAIKQQKYTFNGTSLYIDSPASTLFHLKVLAKNVVKNFDTIMNKGISKFGENGNIITDIPEKESRKEQLRSLNEKAQAILKVLENYEMGLINSLSDGQYSASNKNDFFKNIAGLLVNIQDQIIKATKELPITEEKLQQQLKANDESAQRNLEEIRRQHAIEQNERFNDLMQNKEANNLTAAEWDEFNQWFGNTAKSGAQTISTPINVLLNTTTDVGVNILGNVGKLGETGMTSVINIAWGIATASFILFIPLALIASYKSGLVTTVFKKMSRSIEGTTQEQGPPPSLPPVPPVPPVPISVPISVQGPPQAQPQAQTNSDQSRNRTPRRPTRFGPPVPELSQYVPPTRSSGKPSRWGPPIDGGKKTRKRTKKGQTRKLKRGKRRQTRHRTGRKTKRR